MKVRVGVAIGAGTVAAAWRSGGREERWQKQIPPGVYPEERSDERAQDDISLAFAELARRVNASAVLTVAILPPLARTRNVPLPPMTSSDREAAVTRSARRYFVGMPDDIVCTTSTRSSMVHVVGAGLLGSIVKAADSCGLDVERIVPATEVWAGQVRTKRCVSVVVGGAEVTTLMIDDGRLTAIRRTRDPLESSTGDGPMVLAADEASACLETAAMVCSASVPEFVGLAERRRRHVVERKWSRVLIGAAAASLIAAAVIHRAGLARERAALVGERAALRPRVAAAMAQRDSLMKLRATLTSVASLERTSPRWSAIVGRVAGVLPRDASLASMRAEGDSVSLDGEAQNAAAVFTALRTARGVLAVRPAAPIRQETGPNLAPIERWTLNARVDHAAAVEKSRR